MLLTFYKSALCPRCCAAKKLLLDIIAGDPDIHLVEVDILMSPRKSWKDGIRMIPALKIDDNILSALFLTRKGLTDFITSHKH